jgi:hypothetical protein
MGPGGGFKGTGGFQGHQWTKADNRGSIVGEAKNRPQTKVVELVEGYEGCLRAIFDTGPRWPVKRRILSESRRCEYRRGPEMLPGKYPTSAEGVVTHSLTPDSRSSHKTLLGSSDWGETRHRCLRHPDRDTTMSQTVTVVQIMSETVVVKQV